MSDVSQLAAQIEKLEPVEREELMQMIGPSVAGTVVHESALTAPSIVSTPGVCGGVARIIRTRIPVWTLERMRQLGVLEAELLRNFPTLKAVDLVQAWSYAEAHRDEIERQIRENEEA